MSSNFTGSLFKSTNNEAEKVMEAQPSTTK